MAGEEFACGVERGLDCGGEVVWESSLGGYFVGCALRDESRGVWVVSLHTLCELLCEASCRRVLRVLMVGRVLLVLKVYRWRIGLVW